MFHVCHARCHGAPLLDVLAHQHGVLLVHLQHLVEDSPYLLLKRRPNSLARGYVCAQHVVEVVDHGGLLQGGRIAGGHLEALAPRVVGGLHELVDVRRALLFVVFRMHQDANRLIKLENLVDF